MLKQTNNLPFYCASDESLINVELLQVAAKVPLVLVLLVAQVVPVLTLMFLVLLIVYHTLTKHRQFFAKPVRDRKHHEDIKLPVLFEFKFEYKKNIRYCLKTIVR